MDAVVLPYRNESRMENSVDSDLHCLLKTYLNTQNHYNNLQQLNLLLFVAVLGEPDKYHLN